MRLSIIAAVCLALAPLTAMAQQDIPAFNTYVADPAERLDPAAVPTMEAVLAQLADAGAARIAVLSVADLQGEPAGQYARRALYEWPAGDVADQSALLLLAPDGVVALAIGGRLLPRVSRAEAESVLVETLLPIAAHADLSTAILRAVQALNISLTSDEGGAISDPVSVVAGVGADGAPQLIDDDADAAPLSAEAALASGFDPQPWVDRAAAALGNALAFAGRDPPGFLRQAYAEAQALPAVLEMVSSQPSVPAPVISRYILLGASIGLCVLLWRLSRSPAALLGAVGGLGGLWVWQLSGFAALAVCVMLAGALLALSGGLLGRLKGAVAREPGHLARSHAVGPSQSYQDWLAAQRAKSLQRSDLRPTVRPAAAAATATATATATAASPRATPEAAAGSGRLPGGLIDNRSAAAAVGQGSLGARLSSDRERLHQAGVATPAIDQLLRARGGLAGLNRRKLQVFAIGAAIAIVVLGPLAIVGLIIAGLAWGRQWWAQIKPANTTTADFLKQLAREAEAAAKLRR